MIEDWIGLDDAIFAALPATEILPANAFVIGTAALDSDDRIVYDDRTGRLLYDRDGTGGSAAIQFATIDIGLAVTNREFLIG